MANNVKPLAYRALLEPSRSLLGKPGICTGQHIIVFNYSSGPCVVLVSPSFVRDSTVMCFGGTPTFVLGTLCRCSIYGGTDESHVIFLSNLFREASGLHFAIQPPLGYGLLLVERWCRYGLKGALGRADCVSSVAAPCMRFSYRHLW